jgi:predicted outer membrane repeat protein
VSAITTRRRIATYDMPRRITPVPFPHAQVVTRLASRQKERILNRSIAVKLSLLLTLLSTSAMAGIVGSGTPSSCTEAALQAQLGIGGTVTFNCGAGAQTIAMPNTLFIGQSNPKTIIDGNDTITLDGAGNTAGMISIAGSSTVLPDVTIRHLTIANGNITTGLNAGGAIQNFGKLTLDTVTLRNSTALGGGAIFQEPCTGCLTPTLTVTHCTFQNNTKSVISMEGGIATISDSTFTGNSASFAGAIDVYSNSTFTVVVTIERCTFDNNTATAGGGAIAVDLLNTGSSVVIANDTFTGNSVTDPSGQGSALYISASPVTINNCTIAGNTAPAGHSAIYFDTFKHVTVMNNTIIASNSGGNCAIADGSLTGGNNLQFGDSTCPGITVANPLLAPLANNGGPTKTMALGAGSPAIDAADTIAAPATDQRGNPRTDGNGDGYVIADIGAFEAPRVGNATAPTRHRAVKK